MFRRYVPICRQEIKHLTFIFVQTKNWKGAFEKEVGAWEEGRERGKRGKKEKRKGERRKEEESLSLIRYF